MKSTPPLSDDDLALQDRVAQKLARCRKKLTQPRLANFLHISVATLSRYAQRRSFDRVTAEKIEAVIDHLLPDLSKSAPRESSAKPLSTEAVTPEITLPFKGFPQDEQDRLRINLIVGAFRNCVRMQFIQETVIRQECDITREHAVQLAGALYSVFPEEIAKLWKKIDDDINMS